MASAAEKARLEKKGVKVRPTRAQRRAAFEKQIGHKVGVPKGKKGK